MNNTIFTMTPTIRNKMKGALWGLLVGDALGSPLQFGPPRAKDSYLREMVYCTVFNTPKGCWTDDGSLALCIMDSFIKEKKYNLHNIGQTFWEWQEHGYLSSMPYSFDEGFTTRRAIDNFHKTGQLVAPMGSGTNGGIMRFAPGAFIGMAYNNKDIPIEISSLTHSHPRCEEAAKILFGVLKQAIEGERKENILHGENVHMPFGKYIFDDRLDVHPSGMAIPVLNASLWAFHSTSSFEDALVEVINLGNDSDTSGAICGQIAGAYYGYNAIPKRWIKDMKTPEMLEQIIESFLDTLKAKCKTA